MRARFLALVGGLALACLAAVCAPAQAAKAKTLPPVKHVFLIMLENQSFDNTFGFLSPAHYLAWSLPNKGALVPNYYGVAHESNPNYIALISGQGANPQNQADCQYFTPFLPGAIGPNGQALGSGCVFPPTVKTIADQLTAKHLTWKGYMEDMGNAAGEPKACAHPALNGKDGTQSARKGDQYATRHNPFVYFHSIIDTPACAQNDVALSQLPGDLHSAASTPNYSMIVPNLCNDGHDAQCVDGAPGGLTSADKFLRTWVPQILASPGYRHGGLLIIAFDENDSSDAASCCNEPQFPNTPNNGGPVQGRGGGRVGAVMLSPYIDPGTIDTVAYNHFSLLRSVEDLFGLSHLGYAGQTGLRSFGDDLFTCYRPSHPHPHHGQLPRGSEIKQIQIGQGTAKHPMVEIKLWFAGRVSVSVSPGGHKRSHAVGKARSLGPCQLGRIRLPYKHGTAVVTARAFGGVERRTVRF
jgi:phosphatidylinositol-3-phosphatase